LSNGGTPKALNSVSTVSAPTWILVSVASGDAVLSWSPVSGATGYNIYRGTLSTSLTLLTTIGSAAATYTDTAAGSNTKYFYYVTAVR
jgi:fibronectin type 3 domain-containing protein